MSNNPKSDIHRTLPHSLEAEQGVLGSMLISPTDVISECINRISAAHFYQPAHATIFKILVACWNDQRPADVITLTQILRNRGQLDEVGGPAFITHLFTVTPTVANAMYYLEIVQEKHVLREMIAEGTQMVRAAYEEQGDVKLLVDRVESGIMRIRTGMEPAQQNAEFWRDLDDVIENLEKLYTNRGQPTGLPTGFAEFDKMTSGLQKQDMYVIAARPSVGKTAFAMNIAEAVAEQSKAAVGIFSLEMSRAQLVQRMLCSKARVNLQRARDGFLSERDFPLLVNAAAKMREMKIHIDDRGGLSILQLRGQARRWKQENDIKLLVIDYLQLVTSQSRRAQGNRQVEVAEVSAGIKSLAKELNIPIIVLAQLNRNPEQRATGKPKLSDLRESGAIEQDADLVGLLSRAEYNAESEEEKAAVSGEAMLEIAKQRNGPVGDVKLTFLKEYTRFETRSEGGANPTLPYQREIIEVDTGNLFDK